MSRLNHAENRKRERREKQRMLQLQAEIVGLQEDRAQGTGRLMGGGWLARREAPSMQWVRADLATPPEPKIEEE